LGGIVSFVGFIVVNVAGVRKGIKVAGIILGILSVIGGLVPIGLAAYVSIRYFMLGPLGWWGPGGGWVFMTFIVLVLGLSVGGLWLVQYGSKFLGRLRSPASKVRQRAERYKEALVYLNSCARFTYEDLAKTSSIAGDPMSELDLRQMWDSSKRTLEGAEGVKQSIRKALIEGINTFESLAKELEKR
jgi:hypothetical protein